MKPISNETIEKQLNWRYATKKFDPTRKISNEDWKTLEQALVLSPSSFGLQPWQFIVVNDPAIREKLVAASWNQRQVADASHLVVFAIRKDLCRKMSVAISIASPKFAACRKRRWSNTAR